MSSNNDESTKHAWDVVLQELIDEEEVSEDVLHNSDTRIRWWNSLDPVKQSEITSRVKELSQISDVKLDRTTRPKKKIKETKSTCEACGNVWFYGKQDVIENAGAAMHNMGKALTCCSGCLPAIFIPDQKVIDLNKCPKCGSKAIIKEDVIHEV